jgi:hypothetical protein
MPFCGNGGMPCNVTFPTWAGLQGCTQAPLKSKLWVLKAKRMRVLRVTSQVQRGEHIMDTKSQIRPLSDLEKLQRAVVTYDNALRAFVNEAASLPFELGFIAEALPNFYSNRLAIAQLIGRVRNLGRPI